MLISLPFLSSGNPAQSLELASETLQYSFTGQYPVSSHLEWHNGIHVVAPTATTEVRAIADGKVIYINPADEKPSTDLAHPQNYAAFGDGAEWTDKGMLIIEHTTEIGAKDSAAVSITYYSVYAHLREINANLKVGDKVYRKDSLGKPGQIYAQAGHMHFEICLNDDNLKKLLGQDPNAWPSADAAPAKDGRTDALWGSAFIYLGASTPVQTAVPANHLQAAATQTLGTPQWVQITYAGSATLTSYSIDGQKIGQRSDADAEYKLHEEAQKRHDSLSGTPKQQSSPSGWYELLRFGRNVGRGDAATDKDPLPGNVAHWRKIVTPAGEVWADLNAAGSYKFSDADFPAVLGWNCIGDDTSTEDQRCDSAKLKALLVSNISDAAEKQQLLQSNDPLLMFAQVRNANIAQKLRRTICKFPSEFDRGTFENRYGHIAKEPYFQENPQNWNKLKAHITALTVTDLPAAYKAAQWHFEPVEFINHMRKCMWLSKSELAQCLPSHQIRTGKWTDAHGVKHPGVFWERVTTDISNVQNPPVGSIHRIPLNRTMRRYGITTSLRIASFLGNSMQETGWLSALKEGSPNGNWYAPWYGRGFLQLTHAANYIEYWRWIGRSVPELLKTALQTAATQAHSANSNASLQDYHFPALTQEMKNWRDEVAGEPNPQTPTAEKLRAPSDSAGYYAVINKILKYADEAHSLERVEVGVVNNQGVAQGTKVYYRSRAFWKVSAAVNLPGAVNQTNYHGINGFDSRCSGYGVALAVLTELPLPSATQGSTVEYPEGYTKRSQ